MAATRTLTWSDLPPSEDSDTSAPTMSLVPASPPASTPSPPSTLTSTGLTTSTSDTSPSPTEVPTTTLPTFPHFSSLPREIQFIIWDLAITSVGAAEKYEPYQLLIPAWKYFSTQPWHKGLSCCVPKQKVLCGMGGGSRARALRGLGGDVALHCDEVGRGGRGYGDGKGERVVLGRAQAGEEEMVKRSAHPHIHANKSGKAIYLSPGWARSGLGGIANSCLTGRWLVMAYMKNGLESFESECLEKERQHVLAVLGEVVDEMDGRSRG